MLAKCANPSCSSVFRYLHEGKLFRLESVQSSRGLDRHSEWFWLCDRCAPIMTLKLENSDVVALPLLSNLEESQGVQRNLCLR